MADERQRRDGPSQGGEAGVPWITLPGERPWWHELQRQLGDAGLGRIVTPWLRRCRWFQGKARTVCGCFLAELVPLITGVRDFPILFFTVNYRDGAPETYQIPLVFLAGPEADRLAAGSPQAVVARLTVGGRHGCLCDALYDREFREALLSVLLGRRQLRGERGGVISAGDPGAETGAGGSEPRDLPSLLVSSEQSNSTIIYGSRHVLKLYRRVAPGTNPEVELSRFLTESVPFRHAPPFQGAAELRHEGCPPTSLALLQGYAANQGDSWSVFQRLLDRCLRGDHPACRGESLRLAELLGRRTAELHLALATGGDDPAWRRDDCTGSCRRSLVSLLVRQVRQSLRLLGEARGMLAGEDRERAERLLAAEQELIARQLLVAERRMAIPTIRIHGDLHLGQILFTGEDFVFIDFEGEPAKSLAERRSRQSPLRDVAGMIRSFHYAALTALARSASGDPAERAVAATLADAWFAEVSRRYRDGYRGLIAGSSLIPADRDDLDLLLGAFLLDKALYELAYELNNRPDWVGIPLRGIEMLLRG